jgi:hypothetical protein
LYYAGSNGKLMVVQVGSNGAGFNPSTPEALFSVNSGSGFPEYAPSADGKRFLIATTVTEGAGTPPLTVVVNWLAGIKK